MTQRRPAQRHRGRPSRLTSELATALLRDVAAGVPIGLAADRRGVSKSLVLGWVRRGEAQDGKPVPPVYRRFATEYRRARAMFFRVCMAAMHALMFGPWPSRTRAQRALVLRSRVARLMLERRFPEHYGRHRETVAFVRAQEAADTRAHATAPTEATAHEIVVHIFGSVGPGSSAEVAFDESTYHV